MSAEASILHQISNLLESQVAAAGAHAVAIRNSRRRHVTGTLWGPETVVSSEQLFAERARAEREPYDIVTAGGDATKARLVGRDPGTNLLVLRPERALSTDRALHTSSSAVRRGALALAVGADVDGATTARLGLVNAVGPQWYSRAGGRIEQRITLDIRLSRTEEGGPVIDMNGALLGMSTLGPPGQVLVIPSATIEQIVPQLLRDGRVARGWLGLGLQPVAVPDALRDAAAQASGMMVMSVAAGGPGANAGINAGDILLTVDGSPLGDLRRLAARLDESVGKSVELRLVRAGQVLTIEALITVRPES